LVKVEAPEELEQAAAAGNLITSIIVYDPDFGGSVTVTATATDVAADFGLQEAVPQWGLVLAIRPLLMPLLQSTP